MRLGLLVCLALASWGCAPPVAAHSDAQKTPSPAACVETPPWGSFTIERTPDCPLDTDVMVRAGATSDCMPRVTPEQLASSAFWSRPVLLQEATRSTWDRNLHCKSMRCLYPGLGILMAPGATIPVQLPLRGPPWTSSDVLCPRPGPNRDCPISEPAVAPGRAWIGIVRPHFSSDGLTPTLTFDLLAVEQTAE